MKLLASPRAVLGLLAVTAVAGVAVDAMALCPRDKPDCNDPDRPKNQPTHAIKGSIFPAYVLATTLYDPPGNMSEVDYANGSSTGSQFSDQHLFKGGATIQTQGNVQVSAGFAAGGIVGSQFTVNKQRDTTLVVTSTTDQMTHQKDVYYLWVNPEVTLSQIVTQDGTAVSPVSQALASANGPPVIVPVTTKELQNPSTIPAYKLAQLKALKTTDFSQILALNPMVTGQSPASIPGRFVKQATLQLDGPDVAGDPLTGAGVDIITTQQQGNVTGWTTATTLSVTFGTKFSFFGLLEAGVQGGFTAEWDYTKTLQQNVGTNQGITVKLMTSTVGFHDVIDVYLDTAFNSFAFVSQTGSSIAPMQASAKGRVRNLAGAAVPNERLEITFADGSKRTVFTNARGIYRVFRAPPGKIEVTHVAAGRKVAGSVAGGLAPLADIVVGR